MVVAQIPVTRSPGHTGCALERAPSDNVSWAKASCHLEKLSEVAGAHQRAQNDVA